MSDSLEHFTERHTEEVAQKNYQMGYDAGLAAALARQVEPEAVEMTPREIEYQMSDAKSAILLQAMLDCDGDRNDWMDKLALRWAIHRLAPPQETK